MSAKMLLPNQCVSLHFLYGRDDCCLCKANDRIRELENELENLKKILLNSREIIPMDKVGEVNL